MTFTSPASTCKCSKPALSTKHSRQNPEAELRYSRFPYTNRISCIQKKAFSKFPDPVQFEAGVDSFRHLNTHYILESCTAVFVRWSVGPLSSAPGRGKATTDTIAFSFQTFSPKRRYRLTGGGGRGRYKDCTYFSAGHADYSNPSLNGLACLGEGCMWLMPMKVNDLGEILEGSRFTVQNRGNQSILANRNQPNACNCRTCLSL